MNTFYLNHKLIITAAPVLALNLFSVGQDTHYWTQQYGTKATLLGGAVIGGGRDNSSVYYNPSSIAYLDNKNLSVSANAYQLDRIKIKNGAGQGFDLKSDAVHTTPLIISGLLKLKNNPKGTFGYCLLSKDAFNLNFSSRDVDSRNLIADSYSAGFEDYTDQFTLDARLSENFAGWAYGYRFNDKFSIGIGNYGAYRSYHSDWYRAVRIIPTDPNKILLDLSTYDRAYSLYVTDVRTIVKLGGSLNLNKWKFGLTLTSPSIHIYGNGGIQSDITIVNIPYFSDSLRVSLTANDKQTKLETNYKTPLIIGGGFEYRHKKIVLAFSAEWFDKVDEYTVIQARSGTYLRPAVLNISTSDEILKITETKNSVLNFAVGAEYILNDKYSCSVSFRTNKSYAKPKEYGDINLTYTSGDIYHTSFGVTQKREKSDLSVAINYAFGQNNNQYQFVNSTNTSVSNLFVGEVGKTTASFVSASLVIGYTHYLK